MSKGFLKILVDAAMCAFLLFLMSYPLTRGLMRHGVCGCILLTLFLYHHLLNLSWHRALFKGRWKYRRILTSCADCLLLLAVLALLASSLAMAGEVFPFAPFPMPFWGLELHKFSSAWTFALISFHLGLHGQKYWNIFWRKAGKLGLCLLAAGLAAGAWLFLASGLWKAMLLSEARPALPENLGIFLLQYIGMGAFFCLLAQSSLKLGNYK